MTSGAPKHEKDVNAEWILANFDLNRERRQLKRQSYEWTLHVAVPNPYASKRMTLTAYLKAINDEVEVLRQKNPEIPKNAVACIISNYNYEGTPEVGVIFEWKIHETDAQVIQRLIRREKGRISRAKRKEAEKRRQEEIDRKEFARLQKKFGKGK